MAGRIISLLLGVLIIVSGIGKSDGFYTVCGSEILYPAGVPVKLRGMGFGNNFWDGTLDGIGLHHNEDSFREMAELGFNSVRFLLNYRWFEDDSQPYTY